MAPVNEETMLRKYCFAQCFFSMQTSNLQSGFLVCGNLKGFRVPGLSLKNPGLHDSKTENLGLLGSTASPQGAIKPKMFGYN